MIILGFSGFKQSGKSTACEVINKNFKVTNLSLANKMKNSCSKVFEIARSDFEDGYLKELELDPPLYLDQDNLTAILEDYKEDFKHFNITVDFDKHIRPHIGQVIYSRRKLLQYIGTEFLKNIDQNLHCKVLSRLIDLGQSSNYLISDLRFPDEFEFFKKFAQDNPNVKFLAYYIQNNKAEQLASKDLHPSEKKVLTLAKSCDKIENNGSLPDFQSKILTLAKKIL